MSYVDDRETFFAPPRPKDTAMPHGMNAQYLNECVDKRIGMEVTDADGDIWGWVHDQHKNTKGWVMSESHDVRVRVLSYGGAHSDLHHDHEPYRFVMDCFPSNPDPLEGSIHTPASFTEGMEAHISDPVKPYQHIQVSGYNPAEWKDPGNLPEGQEWCEDCGEGHPTENDPVNPGHYQGFSNGAEVIDITENLTFSAGNAVKYLSRAGRIDGQNKGAILEDLRKAAWYVAREIDRIENQS